MTTGRVIAVLVALQDIYFMYLHDEPSIMQATAKLFTSGGSQAIRLPMEFRFPGAEVFIRRNPRTNEVVLSPKPASWQEFFALADSAAIPADFMDDRADTPAQERELF